MGGVARSVDGVGFTMILDLEIDCLIEQDLCKTGFISN